MEFIPFSVRLLWSVYTHNGFIFSTHYAALIVSISGHLAAHLADVCLVLPLRFISYRQKAYHYFLFDLCYYITILNFVYIWILPGSATLLVACYCLSHGSLASAVITWRNSLVFHDVDKLTSLIIHIYAPFTFTTIRHYYPNSEQRFPALTELPHLNPIRALLFSSAIYMIWQGLYWKFVYVDRREKIESGQRTTSLSYLLADKRGAIGRALSSIPAEYRVATFMFGQFCTFSSHFLWVINSRL